MAAVDDLVTVVGEVVAAVNLLEAAITEAVKGQGVPAEVEAKIAQAVADLKAAVADAADGVDEGAGEPEGV